jgi:hypothetical protein
VRQPQIEPAERVAFVRADGDTAQAHVQVVRGDGMASFVKGGCSQLPLSSRQS